jgi:hypothetical protein
LKSFRVTKTEFTYCCLSEVGLYHCRGVYSGLMKPFAKVAEIDAYAQQFGNGPFVAFCFSVPIFFYRSGLHEWTWVFYGYVDSERWTAELLGELLVDDLVVA